MSNEEPPRPDALPFDPRPVPDTLTNLSQWVAWRYQFDTERDEWTKVPVDIDTDGFAKSTDPDTWTSFADAVAYHERNETDTDGIGFVPDGGNRGDVDAGDGHLDVYDSGRYLTVTGQRIDSSPEDVLQIKDEIADVHAAHIADPEPERLATKPAGDGGVKAGSPGANPGLAPTKRVRPTPRATCPTARFSTRRRTPRTATSSGGCGTATRPATRATVKPTWRSPGCSRFGRLATASGLIGCFESQSCIGRSGTATTTASGLSTRRSPAGVSSTIPTPKTTGRQVGRTNPAKTSTATILRTTG